MAEFSSRKSLYHSAILTFCTRLLLDSWDQNLLTWKFRQIGAYKETIRGKWPYLLLWP